MSKSVGQVVGGIVGATLGFMFLGATAVGGTLQGLLLGSSIGGMIDPPPGPNLKGPTLEDKSFNSAAYGVSLATLHGTIAHTGSIIYLENNEYKAVAKKQKTGGKGGAPKGSYTTTTYFATFAVAIGEAMPGSVIRRIWAGGKLIYSVGETVDVETIRQSNANAAGWRYYNGTQTDPDSRSEAVLGVGNCPSYEGTAYIMFYDFDLTEYGNGLQGCPIKVEVIADFETVSDELPFQKVFESVINYPAAIYDPFSATWRGNSGWVRALTPGSALFIAHHKPLYGGDAVAVKYSLNVATGDWESITSELYGTDIHRYPGLTFSGDLHWQQYDLTSGTMPNNYQDGSPSGWSGYGNVKITFGGRLHYGSFNWDDQPSLGAIYGNGHFYVINNTNILKLSSGGSIQVSRPTDDSTGGTYYQLWYDSGFLYRGAPTAANELKIWVYDGETLETVRVFTFGYFPASDGVASLQFAVYGGLIVVGWATRNGALDGELHYEQWRFKDFNAVQPVALDAVVGRHMSASGVPPALRDLTQLENDFVNGYRIAEAGSARGKLGPLQIAYLFDLIENGYKIKAVKRGGNSIVNIPLSKLGARGAGESLGVLVRRDRETESQLPSRYSLTYVDYNREYDTNTQYADYPSRASNEANKQLPIVLSATEAAQLADVLINLAWVERFSYEFTVPQEFTFLKPSDVINVEVSAGAWVVLRVSSITYGADQRIAISARRAEPAVYQSGAVGIAVTPPSENIPIIVAANTVMMDLPAVNDATTTYGFGVAMSGGQSWKGGALLRSIDSGQTYDAVQAFSANCTIGRAGNYLAAGDYFVIDRVNELNISVIAGEFFSITEAQMLTGKHYCAYGADGRWEIIQYATATVISGSNIKLSTFVRGLFGTEWAGDLHQANDMLVLLDDPDTAFVGADAVALNSPRKFKGVTTGQDAQDATELNFTYRGTNLKPLSPVSVTGELVAEVWTISCTKRTRMASNQWSTGIAAPIGEVVLLFEFDIYDGSVFKKTYQSNTEIFVYSPVNQFADFGYLPTTLTVKIYQISAVIGRGFGVEKTLIGVGDIYGDSVVLLLHFIGANGSTAFVDSSKAGRAITAVGNAQISTAQSKFGGTSCYFDGAGDYLQCAGSSSFVFSGDFTVESWVYIAGNSTNASKSFTILSGATSGASFDFVVAGNGTITGTGLAMWDGAVSYSSNYAISQNAWHHVAFARTGTALRMFVDGVLIGTHSQSISFGNSAWNVYSGGQPIANSYYLLGYIDDLRVTKGVARYASDFTWPMSQFPDPI